MRSTGHKYISLDSLMEQYYPFLDLLLHCEALLCVNRNPTPKIPCERCLKSAPQLSALPLPTLQGGVCPLRVSGDLNLHPILPPPQQDGFNLNDLPLFYRALELSRQLCKCYNSHTRTYGLWVSIMVPCEQEGILSPPSPTAR